LESREYKLLEVAKGSKALEDWNWQVKGSASKHDASEEKRKGSVSDVDCDILEKELIKIDQQLEKDGGYYFRKGRGHVEHEGISSQMSTAARSSTSKEKLTVRKVGGKGSASKRTPNTAEDSDDSEMILFGHRQ